MEYGSYTGGTGNRVGGYTAELKYIFEGPYYFKSFCPSNESLEATNSTVLAISTTFVKIFP